MAPCRLGRPFPPAPASAGPCASASASPLSAAPATSTSATARTSARTARCRRSAPARSRSSTPPTRPACATSTPRAPTGAAEEFLGDWLRDRDPADVVVGSKWGYVYTADWEVAADPPEVKYHDVDTFRRQLEETRANLGDRLALYQIHSATPDSGVLENDAVLAALAELRETGVAHRR